MILAVTVFTFTYGATALLREPATVSLEISLLTKSCESGPGPTASVAILVCVIVLVLLWAIVLAIFMLFVDITLDDLVYAGVMIVLSFDRTVFLVAVFVVTTVMCRVWRGELRACPPWPYELCESAGSSAV